MLLSPQVEPFTATFEVISTLLPPEREAATGYFVPGPERTFSVVSASTCQISRPSRREAVSQFSITA